MIFPLNIPKVISDNKKCFVFCVFVIMSFTWLAVHWFLKNSNGLSLLGGDNDFNFYFSGWSWLLPGMRLFKDGYAEYPLLGIAYISWPKIFTNNFEIYSTLLRLSNLVLYVISGYLIWALNKKFKNDDSNWWWWCLPSVLYFSLNRFDIFPVSLVLFSVWLMVFGNIKFGWLVYGLAVVAKIYPVLLLPLYLSMTPDWRKQWSWLVFFLLPMVLIGLIGIVSVGWLAVIYPLLIQSSRNFEPGSLIYVLFGFSNLTISPQVVRFFSLLLVTILPLIWLISTIRGKMKQLTSRDNLAVASLVLLFFIYFCHFYSPQWWLWVLPFLIFITPSKAWWMIFLYDVLNYLQIIFFMLTGRTSIEFQVVVVLRSLVLCGLIWFVIYKVWLPSQGRAFKFLIY